ncbi:unnamed protein product [Cladocopium goreaui]|uniref:Actin-related protein 2/3 complex subunit 5 n=1 Tax=Cladocopium goreaui TaxID=2562237 RepID=A0A9P1DNK4_9DINO|nr:unnamed protein product [Cladocopium goreaui]|mmetsp:Transcript_42486/g.92302  ORF Transcript_42486/g.92302 Transcript_42486/m.92302 type:complete len:130 (-) Transcript_42486:45-434(-)
MAELSEEEWRAKVMQHKAAVEELLKARKSKEALAEALRDPPYGAPEEVKLQGAKTVLYALSAFREAEIKEATEKLDEEKQNTLMKYLYKFWSQSLPSRTNAQLFVWHAALVEKAGTGSIVRVLYDCNRP